jgi:precorrin-6B methylase 2
MRWWLAAAICAATLATGPVRAQERFSIFVGSNPESIDRMVAIAGLRDGDVVTDLGSGDGRIVISAVKSHPGVRGWGVDIDEKLVRESNAEAHKEGLSGRVRFLHQNAFDADLSQASVIFMWLWPEFMYMLRTKILAEARPGTRVVTNMWDLGSWKPDATDDRQMPVHMWVVPAQVRGSWHWDLTVGGIRRHYAGVLEQQFQQVEGVVRAGDRRGVFRNMALRGEDISFTLDMTLDGSGQFRHTFNAKVRGDQMLGTVRIVALKREDEAGEAMTLPFQATRNPKSAYFAPTGLVKR